MKPPRSVKEAQQLIGKMRYIRRFIPAMGELIGPLRTLLKDKDAFVWTEKHQDSYKTTKHYFQAHTIEVMSKSEGIKCLLQNLALTGRMGRWALLMSEYDIRLVHPTKLRSQALADMLAACSRGGEDLNEELRGDLPEVHNCEEHKDA
ncbi:hypothetical protein SESBI_49782 [Sesbania bispinosa]|nr:hypothetical protein SESBI_49782 [Sesbania bispinosa]